MTHYRNIHSCRSNKTTTIFSLDWPFLRRSYKMFRTDHLSIQHSVYSDNKTEQLEIMFLGSWKPWLTWLHFMPSTWLAATSWRAPLACIKRLLTRTVHLILHRLETFCRAEKVKTHNKYCMYGKEQRHFCWDISCQPCLGLTWLDLGPWEGEGMSPAQPSCLPNL